MKKKKYPIKEITSDSPLGQAIAQSCFSMWEGCCCGLDKGHEGLHSCAAETCDDTWTTEQSDEWEEKIQEWMKTLDD